MHADPEYPTPDRGTVVYVEAASDGRVYLAMVDATGEAYQLPMLPGEADRLGVILIDKAQQARDFVGVGSN